MTVVMLDIDTQSRLEISSPEDNHPKLSPSERADEPFIEWIREWSPDQRAYDPCRRLHPRRSNKRCGREGRGRVSRSFDYDVDRFRSRVAE
jgi:hypothetical protein